MKWRGKTKWIYPDLAHLTQNGARAMVRFLSGGSYSDARGPLSIQSLPVHAGGLDAAVEYYTSVFGFTVASASESAALLVRDKLTIGLAENGGEPEQEGAFIEVDDIDQAWAELSANGLVRGPVPLTLALFAQWTHQCHPFLHYPYPSFSSD